MNWAGIVWYSSGANIKLNGRIDRDKYPVILNDNVLRMATLLLPESTILHDDNAPIHTA